MIGQEGFKFEKGRLRGEVCSESSLQEYTAVISNKSKIIQVMNKQGVSRNRLAVRPQFRDHRG